MSLVINVDKVLKNDRELSKAIEDLLIARKDRAKALVGKTTITSYRRIHEILGSVLDKIESQLRTGRQINIIDLSKVLVLISYQEARGQISKVLANYLKDMVRTVLHEVGRSETAELRGIVSRARTLIDAFTVLVYEYGKK